MTLKPELVIKPKLVIVVAFTENRVIGNDGALPWHLPADLFHFKRLTVGKPVIMGRKVYDAIGKPLPQRQNIILSRNDNFKAEGCTVVSSKAEALAATELQASEPLVTEIAIIGGSQIYNLFLPEVQRIEQTLIHAQLTGDTFFAKPAGNWEIIAERFRPADLKNKYDMTFQTLIRKD